MSLALLLAALLAQDPPAETPRAFIDRVYAGYDDEDYSPLADPDRIFAPPLVAAIREDERLSGDEVGFMDADPLCQCQDPAGIRPLLRELRRPSGKTAVARILLRFDGSDEREIRLRLIRTASGWRIADVGTAADPSLLRDLRRFNRRRSAVRG